MTQSDFDLDAYLLRLGYSGPRTASLDVLRDLHRLHVSAIPFENLSPLMGEPVPLDVAALQAKLVHARRGGYCFEHNTLLWTALATLGFRAQGLAARVRWGQPEDAPPRPRSHMALLVDLPEGQFVADVGFGGITMSGPLALVPGEAQTTPHERFRLTAAPDDAYDLQAEADGGWRTLYRFDLTPHLPADYEPLNWTAATHPASPFPSTLMAARAAPGRRLALAGLRYTVRERDRPAAERTIASLDELGRVLTEDFGLTLPAGFDRVGPRLGLG